MSSFERLKDELLRLGALEAPARQAALDRLAAEDPALAAELVSLLAHRDDSPRILQTGGGMAAFRESTDGAGAAAPADGVLPTIGPYQAVDVLGEGGMGTVYRARQSAPIRRDVALKLIRKGLDTDRVVARFDAERQMLAVMDHPGIARVFDAGAAADGRPYFAMELVEGASITDVADRERLDIDGRLRLFLAVCRAVQHAHQKGIIHRDLKPSNILVPILDGHPTPKIIDFGIAKAMSMDGDRAGATMPGHLVGTPDYASPEQAGAVSAPVDTRTDVYALGLVLYELLSGARPFALTRSTPADALRTLATETPVAPSRRATDAATAGARQTTPERLARRLAGDLDTIVLRALERAPADRYGSVEQLAADVERHLDGRPIEARPPSVVYRMGKFVRRHVVSVAATAVTVLLLVGLAGYASWQSARLARERDRAQLQATTAEAVSSYLVDLFRHADPDETRGTAVTARQLLDQGAASAADLKGDPRVRARLMGTLGEVYQSLGLYEESRRLLLDAQRTFEGLDAPDPVGLAQVLDTLGVVTHDTREFDASEQYLTRALALRREALGTGHEDTATTITNLAITLRNLGRRDEAEALYREALAINRRVLGNEHVEVAWSLFSLGWALHQQGRLDEAEPLYREAAGIQRRQLGPDHPDLAGTLNSYAGLAYQRGRFDEAARLWQEAFDIYEKVYGDQHAATGRAYNNLAMASMGLADYPRAEALYRKSVEINLAMTGPTHLRTATSMLNHGEALRRLGRLDEAEERLTTALANIEKAEGADARPVGGALARLAQLRLDQGAPAAALALARRAAALGQREAEAWPADAARMLEALANALVASGDDAGAVPVWREVVALRDRAGDASPQDRATARAALGVALARTGDRDRGRALITEARSALEPLLPASHPMRLAVESQWKAVESGGVVPAQ
ncbi:MAG: serine/threonine-protein kinase [Vicinamibacterales bacterium]